MTIKPNAVFQLDCYKDNSDNQTYEFLVDYCVPSIKKYCEKYNIEYNLVRYIPEQVFTYNEKIKLWTNIANDKTYNKTLFLDLDVYIKDNSPNIFEIDFEHTAGCLAMHYRLQEAISHLKERLSQRFSAYEHFRVLNCSVRPNGGVILFNNSKIQPNMFNEKHIENELTEDEAFLTYKIANRQMSFTIISDIWNNRTLNRPHIDKSYFIHILSHMLDSKGNDSKRNLNIDKIKSLLQI